MRDEDGFERFARPRVLVVVAAVLAVVVAASLLVASLRDDGGREASEPATASAPVTTTPTPSAADLLLDAGDLAPLARRAGWRVTRTGNNTRGDGLNYVCQQARFADPRGTATLVRTFRARRDRWAAVEALEVSRNARQARRTYERVLGWFAGCQVARLQLLQTYAVRGVGDRAVMLVLRRWGSPATTYSVALTRVGTATSVVVAASTLPRPPTPRQVVTVLSRAGQRLCDDGLGSCAAFPRWRPSRPPPAGSAPGMLAVVDLPPVGGIRRPWVAIDPAPARRRNPAATTCDEADFGAPPARRARTRTYLIPGAPVPVRFGLAETYARFPRAAAADRFVSRLRDRVATCGDRDVATTVRVQTPLRRVERGGAASTYELRTEVGEDVTVRFRVGLVRVGTAVAQVTFAPGDTEDMTDAAFDGLVLRAGERLRELR